MGEAILPHAAPERVKDIGQMQAKLMKKQRSEKFKMMI